VVTHWGWGPRECCYGAEVVAEAVIGLGVGTAVGVAAAARPMAPSVVYAPPPMIYAAPSVVYPPGYYYIP